MTLPSVGSVSRRLTEGFAPAPARSATLLYGSLVGFLLVIVATRIGGLAYWPHTMDDAFMFIRYADHVVHQGSLSWNALGKPTYGLTAPAYLAIVIPIHLLLPSAPGVAIVLSSVVSGLLFLALLYVLLAKFVGAAPRHRPTVVFFVVASLAIGGYPLAFHFSSGMDTLFALAMVTALLIGHCQDERRPTPLLTGVLGLATGLIFFVRPDLMIYSAGIPAVGLTLAPDTATRKRFAIILGVGAAVLGLELSFTSFYFGLPLPLPFYAKGLHSYTGRILAVYRYTSYEQFLGFVERYWPLFLLVVAAVLYLPRRRGMRVFSPVELGVAASTLVFLGYYLFFVLQILPHESRFYLPTLPALFFLATRSLVLLLEAAAPPLVWLEQRRAKWMAALSRHPRFSRGVSLAILAMVAGATYYRVRPLVASAGDIVSVALLDVHTRYALKDRDIWYRLDEVSRLPDDLVIGTTEVGILSAFNPGKEILDLAGLNDTDVVKHGFRVDVALAAAHPDLLYMPYPDYTDLIRSILEAPGFDKEFELFSAESLGCVMGIAIRRDSKYVSELRAIAEEGPLDLPRIHTSLVD
jgi:hypothetical protein